MVNRSKKHPKFKRKYLLLAAIILLTIGIVWALRRDTDPLTTDGSADTQTSQESPEQAEPEAEATNGSPAKAQSSSSTANGKLELSDKTTFVSSHNAMLNGDVESICVTTLGATCYINFTSGQSSHSLDAKQANSDGVVAWIWTPKSVGLSTGEWKVSAITKLNGQSETKVDAYPLIIQ